MATIVVWNNSIDNQPNGKWIETYRYEHNNKHIFIPVDRAGCLYLLFTEIQIGTVCHRKGGYPFYPVPYPFFTPRGFLVFMLVSFAATLLMWGIYILLRKGNSNVPLISGIGVCLCVLLIYQQLIRIL